MALDQTALALLVLFGTAALKVYGCVCYVGQEPNQATGKRYGWSIAEQRPCECTEFRLGGVNMKPQLKPFEVKIGEGNRLSIKEQGQIIQSPDCTENQSGTTFEGTSLCAANTHRFYGIMELKLPMTSPMLLEFTVNTNGFVRLYFSPIGPGSGEALYQVGLSVASGSFYKWESSSRGFGSPVQRIDVNCIGVPVMITYDNGRFELAVHGVQNSTLTYDVPSPAQPSWFVTFEAVNAKAELNFTEPCINDFNPQFNR